LAFEIQINGRGEGEGIFYKTRSMALVFFKTEGDTVMREASSHEIV